MLPKTGSPSAPCVPAPERGTLAKLRAARMDRSEALDRERQACDHAIEQARLKLKAALEGVAPENGIDAAVDALTGCVQVSKLDLTDLSAVHATCVLKMKSEGWRALHEFALARFGLGLASVSFLGLPLVELVAGLMALPDLQEVCCDYNRGRHGELLGLLRKNLPGLQRLVALVPSASSQAPGDRPRAVRWRASAPDVRRSRRAERDPLSAALRTLQDAMSRDDETDIVIGIHGVLTLAKKQRKQRRRMLPADQAGQRTAKKKARWPYDLRALEGLSRLLFEAADEGRHRAVQFALNALLADGALDRGHLLPVLLGIDLYAFTVHAEGVSEADAEQRPFAPGRRPILNHLCNEPGQVGSELPREQARHLSVINRYLDANRHAGHVLDDMDLMAIFASTFTEAEGTRSAVEVAAAMSNAPAAAQIIQLAYGSGMRPKTKAMVVGAVDQQAVAENLDALADERYRDWAREAKERIRLGARAIELLKGDRFVQVQGPFAQACRQASLRAERYPVYGKDGKPRVLCSATAAVVPLYDQLAPRSVADLCRSQLRPACYMISPDALAKVALPKDGPGF